jgi:hypothetical protein
MERPTQDIWDEIRRTVALIEGYQPLLDQIEQKVLLGDLSGEDARALTEVVADTQILCSLIRDLERRDVRFD